MTIRLNGSTSGYVEIDAPATAGSNTIVLPSGNGSANQLLKNGSTAGSLEFSSSVYIDSSQRLLVGTSTARTNFFNGSTFEPKFQVEATGTPGGQYVSLTSNANSVGWGGAFVLAKSRGSTIGSNTIVQSGDELGFLDFQGSDGTEFVPAARILAEVDGTPGANDMPGRLVFSTTADGASSPTERMRITSGGSTYFIATSEPNASVGGAGVLSVSGGALVRISRTGTSSQGVMDFFNSNGGVGSITTSGSSTAFNTSSDYRLKENIVPLTGATARINQLKPSQFNFKADPDTTVDGFIAHEAQAVVPECVTGTKDEVDADGNPVYQGIDQSKLVPLLTAALQEALAKIETLESRLTALEA